MPEAKITTATGYYRVRCGNGQCNGLHALCRHEGAEKHEPKDFTCRYCGAKNTAAVKVAA